MYVSLLATVHVVKVYVQPAVVAKVQYCWSPEGPVAVCTTPVGVSTPWLVAVLQNWPIASVPDRAAKDSRAPARLFCHHRVRRGVFEEFLQFMIRWFWFLEKG